MPAVLTVVSWMASSMKRSSGWPRRFSLTTTPLTSHRFSNDIAPEMVVALPVEVAGPVLLTPAARLTVLSTSRPIASFSTSSLV
jgi:hypothetical protein